MTEKWELGLLRTKRLILEPFSEKHLSENIVGWLNDPEVVRYSDQRHREHTLESSRAYLESFAGSSNGYWAILVSGKRPTMIGSITAYIDERNAVADVGILVGDKNYWKGGYGTEAFAAVLDWLFRHRGMRKIVAGTMANNEGMLGVMRNVGMHVEGCSQRYYLWDGKEIDMVHATIYAENWKNRPTERDD